MSHSGGRAARASVVAVVTLLVVLLPALVAGAGIDQPTDPVERARSAAAADDASGESGGVANLFYAPFTGEPTAGDPPRARLGSLVGILAISGLLYAAVVQARGRGQALLACLVFAALPPVAIEGAIVRPEVPGTVFAALGLAILVGMPLRLAAARRARAQAIGWLTVVALALAVGTAEGLSVAALPALGVHLLVPAGCMLIAVVQHGLAYLAVLRRFRLLVLPSRAFALRIAPWLLAAFAGLAAGAVLLGEVASPPEPTESGVGLWPTSMWAFVPTVALAAIGGVTWLFGVGLRLGRRRRLAPEAVLAVYVLVLLIFRFKGDASDDALPAAPALAVVLAEGVRLALLLGGAALSRVIGR